MFEVFKLLHQPQLSNQPSCVALLYYGNAIHQHWQIPAIYCHPCQLKRKGQNTKSCSRKGTAFYDLFLHQNHYLPARKSFTLSL